MKAFKAMAEVIAKLPAETQKEILDALTEDFDELTGLIEQSKLNSQSYSDKVGVAVDYANKRKDPNAKHFSRWDIYIQDISVGHTVPRWICNTRSEIW